jgi:hypothetical protein
MNQYVGIADCHGIESFVPWTGLRVVSILNKDTKANSLLNTLHLRVMANRQRHAVLYRVDLEKDQADIIEKLVNEGKYKEALVFLKNTSKKVEISKGMEKSWKLIPNDDLDPYY